MSVCTTVCQLCQWWDTDCRLDTDPHISLMHIEMVLIYTQVWSSIPLLEFACICMYYTYHCADLANSHVSVGFSSDL